MQHFGYPVFLGLVVVSTFVFGSLSFAQQPDSIGSVTALEGKATITHSGSLQSEPLILHSLLYQEDTIQTEAASKTKLTFADGTIVMLGEKSTLTITKFVYAPPQKTHSLFFSIPLGIFRMLAQKILPQSQFEVTTSTAVAALRGTDWMGEATVESTGIVVLVGQVAVTSVRPEISGEVLLTNGMGTDVASEQPPLAPKRWGATRINAMRRATTLP